MDKNDNIINEKKIIFPIRIAVMMTEMNYGGVEAVVMNYYRHIDHSKVQFDFFVLEGSEIPQRREIEELGGRIYVVPKYTKILKYRKTLINIFKENNYLIVHSHMNALSVFSLSAAKKAGVPIRIAHSHSTANMKEWGKTFIKNLLKHFSRTYATHYFACSELAGRWLFGDRAFENGLVTIINNAVDLDRFVYNEETRIKIRKELKINEEFVIGHIGRFCKQKNHSFLIDVFNEFQNLLPNSKLLLIGNGELENSIKAKVETFGISSKVIFAGVSNCPEKYYSAMDCFILTSLYEGLPVVGVEAQTNGLPCLLSSEMTKETKILESTRFLPLDSGAKVWAKTLTDFVQTPRNIQLKKIEESGFDINIEAGKLADLYIKLIINYN